MLQDSTKRQVNLSRELPKWVTGQHKPHQVFSEDQIEVYTWVFLYLPNTFKSLMCYDSVTKVCTPTETDQYIKMSELPFAQQ